jgi:hypothetical protein
VIQKFGKDVLMDVYIPQMLFLRFFFSVIQAYPVTWFCQPLWEHNIHWLMKTSPNPVLSVSFYSDHIGLHPGTQKIAAISVPPFPRYGKPSRWPVSQSKIVYFPY